MTAQFGWMSRIAMSGLLAATGALALCEPAFAEVAPPFATLLHQSENAPRRAESAAEVARAEGLAQQARARPNPTIGVLTENIAGSSPYRGFDRAETTIQLSQPFELGGKRASRIAAGEAGVVAARARDFDTRVTYAYDLARAYAVAELADSRIALAENEVEEADNDLRTARALVAAGKEARLRSLQAESSGNAARAELEVARSNRIAAFARLSALAGAEAPFTALGEGLLARPALLTGPVDPATASTIVLAQAEREAAERRLVAERRRANPEVTVIVGVRRLEFERATALTAGVSIPLQIFDRSRGTIAASSAEVRIAEARLAIARGEALAAAQTAQAQLTAAEARVGAAQNAQATADEAYRLARIAYGAGKTSLLDLLGARRGLAVARGTVLDTQAARFEARAQIARLQGRSVTGEPVQ